jgi:hypothetical protein
VRSRSPGVPLPYHARAGGTAPTGLLNVIERNHQWGWRGRRWHRGHE